MLEEHGRGDAGVGVEEVAGLDGWGVDPWAFWAFDRPYPAFSSLKIRSTGVYDKWYGRLVPYGHAV